MRTDREIYEAPNRYSWIVYAVAMVVFGGMAGYIIALQGGRASAPAPIVASAATTPTPSAVVDESELRAYRDILSRDPKNVTAAVKAANVLYDAGRYTEAIGFYQQAFALNPSDISVSTDLGTALFYAGRSDEALAQYQKSLAINPKHEQTLHNIDVVRASRH